VQHCCTLDESIAIESKSINCPTLDKLCFHFNINYLNAIKSIYLHFNTVRQKEGFAFCGQLTADLVLPLRCLGSFTPQIP
jgi:hypothetical protein